MCLSRLSKCLVNPTWQFITVWSFCWLHYTSTADWRHSYVCTPASWVFGPQWHDSICDKPRADRSDWMAVVCCECFRTPPPLKKTRPVSFSAALRQSKFLPTIKKKAAQMDQQLQPSAALTFVWKTFSFEKPVIHEQPSARYQSYYPLLAWKPEHCWGSSCLCLLWKNVSALFPFLKKRNRCPRDLTRISHNSLSNVKLLLFFFYTNVQRRAVQALWSTTNVAVPNVKKVLNLRTFH